MVLTLPSWIVESVLRQQVGTAYVWLWKIVADRTEAATTVFRICAWHEPITFLGQTYYPFPVGFGNLRQATDGDLLTAELTISNATREMAYYAELGHGFHDMPVTGYRLNVTNLTAAVETLDLVINDVMIGREAITFALEAPNVFVQPGNQGVFTRDGCQNVFKDDNCAYRGPEAACNRTFARCVQIGNLEVAAGFARRHPRNYRAFPGLPRRL